MSRSALVDNVTAMFRDAGFVVSDQCRLRPKSFDVAARRGDDLVLLKILVNVDAFDAAAGAELRRLGSYLDATPLLIGLRTRNEELDPEVVYFRHGVPAVHPDTAYDRFVENVPPLLYAAPGGLYVNIDGGLVAAEREERGWSLGRLATELGVSRRTVSKYEDGMNASVEVAVRLEELFGLSLSDPIDVMDGAEAVREADPTPDDPDADPSDEHMVAVLTAAGFTVHPTTRSPFEAVTEDGDAPGILTGHSTFDRTAKKCAELMSSLGAVTETGSVYFVEEPARRDAVDGTAIVSCAEVGDQDPERVRELVRQRASDAAES